MRLKFIIGNGYLKNMLDFIRDKKFMLIISEYHLFA